MILEHMSSHNNLLWSEPKTYSHKDKQKRNPNRGKSERKIKKRNKIKRSERRQRSKSEIETGECEKNEDTRETEKFGKI